jgi:quercetin dioxygenase-like cupin family protein
MPVLPASSADVHELPGTRFSSLATPRRGSPEISMWQVEIAPDTEPVPHELTRTEVFYILGGRAQVRIGGEAAVARAGDVIVVPPDTLFELRNDGDEPLRALCCLPAGGQARRADGIAFTPPWAE